ncbi:MAG: type I phosphomannose isomerase catalytic subunit [Anaerolineae bacterium]
MIAGPIYPLTFTPQLRDYIWGGRNLETFYNRRLPPGITAESWEISGHPAAATVVEDGLWAGASLPQVQAKMGELLVGKQAGWALRRNKFPLLVKLLDANQNLSVQVHPGDDYAMTRENGELGKTEMWYVLHAKPGAKLIFGLKRGVTRQSFRRAIETNTLESSLHYLPVKAGDAIFVAAGSVHALLEGTLVAEIQQNSDVTYRVYDWGRLGADGKPRPLHVGRALDVINFGQIEPGPYQPRPVASGGGVAHAEISRCRYFVVETVEFEAGATFKGHTNGATLEIWGTIKGASALIAPPAPLIKLPAIRFCLIPAALGRFSIAAQTRCTMLRAYLP